MSYLFDLFGLFDLSTFRSLLLFLSLPESLFPIEQIRILVYEILKFPFKIINWLFVDILIQLSYRAFCSIWITRSARRKQSKILWSTAKYDGCLLSNVLSWIRICWTCIGFHTSWQWLFTSWLTPLWNNVDPNQKTILQILCTPVGASGWIMLDSNKAENGKKLDQQYSALNLKQHWIQSTKSIYNNDTYIRFEKFHEILQ